MILAIFILMKSSVIFWCEYCCRWHNCNRKVKEFLAIAPSAITKSSHSSRITRCPKPMKKVKLINSSQWFFCLCNETFIERSLAFGLSAANAKAYHQTYSQLIKGSCENYTSVWRRLRETRTFVELTLILRCNSDATELAETSSHYTW